MLLDLPTELVDAIFYFLDDRAQRNFIATCRAFRRSWLTEAWRTLTLSGPNVKSQLTRLIFWINSDPGTARKRLDLTQALFIRACLLAEDVDYDDFQEGGDNTDIHDRDIHPLINWLSGSLRVLSIDLPPTPDRQFFDSTLASISRLPKLERLFLGRVKVHDGYDVVCTYSGLKEATMIWCHGIVEQRLLVDQPQLEHLDVHDSWDIGNLSAISHQWHNLKSFRFSAIDATYALNILENGRGVMTSLEDVSLEVPMSEAVFHSITTHLTGYPVRRFHLSLSADGLGLFVVTPAGQNNLPDGFGPNWLAVIATSLQNLEELVLDYRSGGTSLDLIWPGEQVAYATALSRAKSLHTLAISIHAIPQYGPESCRDIAHEYMEHIPGLQTVHFPAMPIFTYEQLQPTFQIPIHAVSEMNFRGYTMTRLTDGLFQHSTAGDTYRPFWITCGPDVAVDRHRRTGGLRIVSDGSDGGITPSIIDFEDDLEDEPAPPEFDIFDDEDMDLGPWFPEPNDEDSDFSYEHLDHDHPVPTPDEWMEGLTLGMGNLSIAQLDFSELDGHSSDDLANEHDDVMSHFSEDLPL